MRSYKVNFYSYKEISINEKIFYANTTFIINLGNSFSPTILNNIYTMLDFQRLKIKGNKNEIDETLYNINTLRGVYVIAKQYNN
jgi:hypothetical protein